MRGTAVRARRILTFGIATAATLGGAIVGAFPAEAAPAAPSQWYLSQLHLSSVWQTAKGAGVVVAVLGTGVDAGQADVKSSLKPGVDFTKGQPAPSSTDTAASYDGTQVAALIVGSGAAPSHVKGIAPSAEILPVRIVADTDKSISTYYESLAIRYAADHGARVILVPIPLSGDSQAVTSAVRYAVGKGAVVIAGAGNNGKSRGPLTTPCTSPGAVCVSGVTQSGSLWTGSSSGAAISLAAPGDAIPVPTRNGVAALSSTHFSAALAAGEAALVWSAHPGWTEGQVIRAMIDHTTGGNSAHVRVDDKVGYGTIDPQAAVRSGPPTETTNPFLPISPSKPKKSSGAATSAPATTGAATAASSSGGGGSAIPFIAGGAGAVVIAGALLTWWLIRRRSRGEGFNYAYGTSYYERPPGSRSGSYGIGSQSGSYPTGYPQGGYQQPDPAQHGYPPAPGGPAPAPQTQPFPQQPPPYTPPPPPPAPPGYTAPYAGAPDPDNPDWRNTVDAPSQNPKNRDDDSDS